MIEDTSRELQQHIVECAQNYGKLESAVVLQNQKIDTLVEKIHEMDSRQSTAYLYAFLGVVAVAWFLIQHFVIK
jgi:hypothetical protein